MAAKTLEEYIRQVEGDFFNLRKTSVIDTYDGFEVLTSNVIEDYIPILKSSAISATLTDQEIKKYRYKPRLLSREVYQTENLYYLILLLNDMTIETFIPNQIYLLNNSDRSLVEDVINKERQAGTIP